MSQEVTHLAPEEPTSHYLLAQAYKKLGKKVQQEAELEIFAKLRKAQQERDQNALAAPAKEEDFPDDASSSP